MTGNLNMGSKLINNLTDPVNSSDADTKNYVDSSINTTKVYTANYTFGSSTTPSSVKTVSLSYTGFTASNILLGLVVNPVPSTTFTDQFVLYYYNSTSFTAGNFSFSCAINRTDTNSGWSQNVILQIIVLYK